ncbi:hypothetical protein PsYK624_100510 [Phanerochaete sordida]|uniref:Uncharacterized protein n=1 Tax=Phanerochaete sordida TaxID=48140 RepID=A0A9P3GFL5_9APHY|nr:hypothetical protein PsYK624_100510 [Phanerochaete sordida]
MDAPRRERAPASSCETAVSRPTDTVVPLAPPLADGGGAVASQGACTARQEEGAVPLSSRDGAGECVRARAGAGC